jgi:hypothetical protein
LRPLSGVERNATRWLVENDGGIIQATVSSTDMIAKVGGFDEQLLTGQDWHLALRVSPLGLWCHVPGRPVVVQRESAPGEAEHLSQTYSDCHRRWVQILEEFVAADGGAAALKPREYCGPLATRWYWAGRQLMRRQRDREARNCFLRSYRWQPRWKTLWRLVHTQTLIVRRRVIVR